MKKRIFSLLLAVMLVAVFVMGCGSSSSSSTDDTSDDETDAATEAADTSEDEDEDTEITLEALQAAIEELAASIDFSESVEIDFASAGTKGSTDASIFENWMEEIEELSGGAITFNYYSDGSVGTDSEILTQVMDGSIDAGGCGIAPLTQYCSDLAIFQLPFLIDDYTLEYDAMQTDEWQAIIEEVESITGLSILGQYDVGLRHFASTTGPIETIDDIQGLKIRVATSDLLIEAMTAVGANPITTAYNEIYTSLQNGVVDAEEVNYATFEGQGHYEIVSYFSEIGMYPYSTFIFINTSVAESLPDGYYDLLQAVMAEQEYIYLHETVVASDEESKQICIDNGVEINEVSDPEAFEEACADIYEEYSASSDLAAAFIAKVESLKED